VNTSTEAGRLKHLKNLPSGAHSCANLGGAIRGVANMLRDGGKGKFVVLLCLIREAEEREKNQATHYYQPAREFETCVCGRIQAPDERGELFDTREIYKSFVGQDVFET
jgi:hypothetical protein